MSITLWIKNKNNADAILRELLEKYNQDIADYNIRTDLVELGKRVIRKRGGSYVATLPPLAASYLDLRLNDQVRFILDTKNSRIYIEK